MFEIAFALVVVVLVVGLIGSAMAAPTVGRLTGSERRARLAHTLGILGGLVAGFGVILFFAANWSDIPRPLRVLILLAGMVAFFAAGFVLRELRGTHPHIGHAFMFLGTILYGASIFLVGQMYNVQAHDPFGFLLWSAGAIAIAFLAASGPIAALGILTFFAWAVHELADAQTGADTFLAVPALLCFYGIALYGAGTAAVRWLEPRRFARPMRFLGYAFTVGGLAVFTFQEAHEAVDVESVLDVGRVARLIALFAAGAVLGALALAILRWRDRPTAIGESAALLGAAGLVLLALLEPEVSGEFVAGSKPEEASLYPILFNLLFAIIAFGAVVVGLLANEVWLANAGAVTVGIDILARFFDPQWSMLERGVIFMLVGAGVLAVAAFFERRPRPATAER